MSKKILLTSGFEPATCKKQEEFNPTHYHKTIRAILVPDSNFGADYLRSGALPLSRAVKVAPPVASPAHRRWGHRGSPPHRRDFDCFRLVLSQICVYVAKKVFSEHFWKITPVDPPAHRRWPHRWVHRWTHQVNRRICVYRLSRNWGLKNLIRMNHVIDQGRFPNWKIRQIRKIDVKKLRKCILHFPLFL